jgi:hypothetical protein
LRIAPICLLLAACSGGGAPVQRQESDLESAAITSGAIPDPAGAPLEGLYERSGDGGPDRLCLLNQSGETYRIGIDVRFGDETQCLARGKAMRRGERVTIDLEGKGACRITARFDGRELSLPGSVPPGCADYCTDRGSLAGFALGQTSASAADAIAARARDGSLLCGNDA